jgi:uncharacterized Zn finger protein (UPF0148 family)
MALDVVNCRRCGRLYQRLEGKRVCPVCEQEIEDKFQEVRDYVRQNPNCTIMDVSNDMEVSVDQIKQWVRAERLVFSSAQGSGIDCVVCGTPIVSGKYCEKCKQEVASELGQVYHKAREELREKKGKTSDKSKMRFLNR